MDEKHKPSRSNLLRYISQQLLTTNWYYVAEISLPMALLSTGIILFISLFVPSLIQVVEFGLDWYGTFRPAVLSGQPYNYPNFFSPPWVVLLLYPFALLPPGMDMVAIISISIAIWIIVMRRFGARPIWILLMFFTPQLWWGILYGNIDFLVLIGLLLPAPIGLIFVLVKPQVGIGIAVYWIIESYRRGGYKEFLITVAPISLLTALFCIPYGFWPLELLRVTERPWNISLFPYLIGGGLILLIRAVKKRQPGLALTASPFLSPYVASWSLPVAAIGLLPSQVNMILATLSLWAAWLIRGYS